MEFHKDIRNHSNIANGNSFKGCYDKNAMEKPYQDPKTGAHFYYPDVYKRLMRLQLDSYERLDENICQVAEERATPNILKNYQTTGSKKLLKSLEERFPGTRYVQTCVEDSKQGVNTCCFKRKHSIIKTDEELVLSNKKTNMMAKLDLRIKLE